MTIMVRKTSCDEIAQITRKTGSELIRRGNNFVLNTLLYLEPGSELRIIIWSELEGLGAAKTAPATAVWMC